MKRLKKCLCDNPDCAKCLLVNCENVNCKIHPKQKKNAFKRKYINRGHAHRRTIKLSPRVFYWSDWQSCSKMREDLQKIKNFPGVYQIRKRGGEKLLHIGKAKKLLTRVRQQLRGRGKA